MATPKSLLKGFARTVALSKPDAKKRLTIFDPDTRGLCVRITTTGTKTYTIVARGPSGRQVWAAVGAVDEIELQEARDKAREGLKRIKAGQEPFPKKMPPAPPASVGATVEQFMKRYVGPQELRTAPEIRRIFDVYVLPAWRDRPFIEISRSDVTKLLDDIEDNSGPVMADRVLATISKLANWYAAREDRYSSPIVKGMARSKPRERARKRILTDDELRRLWPALSAAGAYGAMCQVCLLTAQRRAKVAAMRWDDLSQDGTWTIPAEAREKSNAGTLGLPVWTMMLIRARPQVAGNPYVFAGRSNSHIAGFSKFKRALDAAADIEPWTVHDFRRTAKSLMARAGVRPDISERVLGHTIAGVEGVYDRHTYEDEKRDALARLASLVERIIHSTTANVVELRGRS